MTDVGHILSSIIKNISHFKNDLSGKVYILLKRHPNRFIKYQYNLMYTHSANVETEAALS